MWQFGGSTNLLRSNLIAGVVCDQNYMYVDFPEIIKKGGYNGFGSNASPEIQKKSNDEIADEVIAGKWGNGADRFNKLTNAGYDYTEVQALVEQKLKYGSLKAGDKVTLKKDTVFYVREIKGGKVIISTQKTGSTTVEVDAEHLIKI